MNYEDAVRKMFGVDETYTVSDDIEGGGDYQIGDYTWDTEPTKIVVRVSKNLGPGKGYDTKTQEFDTLPEVWAALLTEG